MKTIFSNYKIFVLLTIFKYRDINNLYFSSVNHLAHIFFFLDVLKSKFKRVVLSYLTKGMFKNNYRSMIINLEDTRAIIMMRTF